MENGRRVSMQKMREAIDAYEALGLPLGVDCILVTEDQYYSYERTLFDFIESYPFPGKVSLPDKLKFNGITLRIKELSDCVNNGTLHVTVPTPTDWKCKRKGCVADYKHTHTTYAGLMPK